MFTSIQKPGFYYCLSSTNTKLLPYINADNTHFSPHCSALECVPPSVECVSLNNRFSLVLQTSDWVFSKYNFRILFFFTVVGTRGAKRFQVTVTFEVTYGITVFWTYPEAGQKLRVRRLDRFLCVLYVNLSIWNLLLWFQIWSQVSDFEPLTIKSRSFRI